MSRHPSADNRGSQLVQRRRLDLGRLALLLIGTVLTTAPAQVRAQGAYSDTTIYGWATFTGTTGGNCTLNGSFTTQTNWGRRYHVVVKKGATAPTNVTISIDDQEWVGFDEYVPSADSLVRIIELSHAVEGQNSTHDLDVCVTGATGSSVDVRIYHVTEPTFVVFGPYTFTRLDPIADDITSFLNSYEATTPYQLRVRNGAGNGTNRVSNATLHLSDSQVLSASDFGTGIATITRSVSPIGPTVWNSFCQCFESDVEDVVKGRNESGTGTYFTARIRGTDASAPSLSVSAPVDTHWTKEGSATVSGTAYDDQTKVLVTVSDSLTGAASLPVRGNGGFSDVFGLPVNRLYRLKIRATNSAGLSATNLFRYVKKDTLAPILDVVRPGASFAPVDSPSIALKLTWSDSVLTYITIDGDTVMKSTAGTYQTPSFPLDMGPNRIVFRARDRLGHETTITRLVFRKSPGEGTLPDSVMYAPAISTVDPVAFIDQVSFLYRGDTHGDTLQKAVVIDSIRSDLAGVARGRVTARDFGAIGNVKVRVLGHPEYGYAMTRADGRFDLVVNGGAALTLRFTKSGYLEAQRVFQVPVGSYAVEDNVALIGKSTKMHWVPFDSLRIVRGRFASDANGDRKLLAVFQSGTVAKIARTVGDTASLSGIHLYLTEYTVGADGPRAMPGALPPASAYTYALDFSVDEADSIGKINHPELPAPDVLFTKPVVCYVPNFLHLPVGVAVPYGYYDRRAGKWIAEPDGWVMRILTNNGTTVTVDTKGNGAADGQGRLDSLGITTAELQTLAKHYAAGDTIWREVATRFSNCDFNLPAGFMSGLGPPGMGGRPHNKPPDPCGPRASGSIINCEDRILGERLALTGTPLTLNYQSFRAAGDALIRSVIVPPLTDSVAIGGWTMSRAIVRLEVAGKVYEQSVGYPTTSTPPVTLTWDGKDAYGRPLSRSVPARVSLGYVFRTRYGMGSGGRSLGSPGATSGLIGEPVGDRQIDRAIWNSHLIFLSVPGAQSAGLGGWTISAHHLYDSNGAGNVYLGDGSVIRGDLLPSTVRGVSCPPPHGSCPGSPTRLDQLAAHPSALAFGPDGRLYLADDDDNCVYRVNADGSNLTRVAGNGSQGAYAGDGVATSTPLPHDITSLAAGPDGSLYLASSSASSKSTTLIAVVTPDGQIRKVIGGDGSTNYGRGNGLPASQAYVGYVRSLTTGPDGSLYILDGPYTDSVHVRRIETNGIITNYAGRGGTIGGGATNSDSTGIATLLPINYTKVIATDDIGNLYLITPTNVRRVATDGTILTLMGKPPSTEILNGMVSKDGTVYLATSGAPPNGGFWRRDPDGSLRRIGGEGSGVPSSLSPVPFPSVSPSMGPEAIAIAPDGNPWLGMSDAVLRVDGPFASASSGIVSVPSPDGSEVYTFAKGGPTAGRHLYTRDALTGAVRFRFGYDQAGQLARIYDVNGDSTLINRSGSTTTIVTPYGQTTTLTMDGGFLATVTNPESDVVTFETDEKGLLQTYTDARDHAYTYTFGNDGRLDLDADPAGGSQELSVEYPGAARTVTRETGEGRETIYSVTTLSSGARQRDIFGPDGLRTYRSDSTDNRRRTVLPDNTTRIDSLVPDPRFFMASPIAGRSTEKLNSGIRRYVEVTRPMDSEYNPPDPTNHWIEEVRINGRSAPFRTEFNSATTSRKWTLTTPEGRVTTTIVDSAGRPLRIKVAGQDTLRIMYDARGRIDRVEQGGRGWRYGYDTAGRLATVRDTLQRMTTFAYDNADRLTSQVLPGGRQVQFDYDANGNLTSLTPPGRPAHELDYTEVDLPEQYRPPTAGLSASLTQYRYNKDRQLTRIEAPDSGNVTLSYNGTSGRLEAIDLLRGSFEIFYNGTTGHVDSIASPDTVTLSYGYDGVVDTASAWTGKVVGRVGVVLDQDFRVSSQHVKGDTVGFSYDKDGLLTRAGSLAITRRSDNGLVSGTSLGSVTTEESHTNVGEPWRVTAKYNSTALWQATYGRDSLGRITSVTEAVLGATDTVFAYAYSDSGFLKTVTKDALVTERYKYDGNGNRLRFERAAGADTSTGTYDDQDRLLRYKSTRYSYTSAGELATAVTGADTTRYTYDPLGNLVTVELSTGDRIDYLIDGQQRRVGRMLNGVPEKKWLYQDQLEPVAELDGADSLIIRFVYGTRRHVPDYMVKGGTTYRIVSDHLGSVRLVVNVGTGAIAQRIDYDGFGRVLLDTNPGFQPFLYAGGLRDGETGLVRFGARDYQPRTGRWTSKDPTGFADGTNPYTYVNNSPVAFVDPSGLWGWVFNAGAHVWLPPTMAAAGVNLSASYTADGQLAGTGMDIEAEIGSLWDVGVGLGIEGLYKDPCGGKGGKRANGSLNFGGGPFGTYGGVQLNFVNGHFDGLTVGFGAGMTAPISYTGSLDDFLPRYTGPR